MRVLFIEPHPDDICLSGYFLLAQMASTAEVSLVSCVNKNIHHQVRSSRKFCDQFGIQYLDFGDVEPLFFRDTKIRDILKVNNPFHYQSSHYREKYPEFYCAIKKLVSRAICSVKPDMTVTLVGILHVAHVAVKDAVAQFGTPTVYIADSPYQWRNYGKRILADSKVVPLAAFQPSPSQIEAKLKAFENCYPEEQYMVSRDRWLYYRYPELIFTEDGVCTTLQKKYIATLNCFAD